MSFGKSREIEINDFWVLSRWESAEWVYESLDNKEKTAIICSTDEKYGVSLWGEDGDAEGVTCMIFIDFSSGKVITGNICS